MNEQKNTSAGLQPLSLEDVAQVIGGALATPDFGDTGPSTGGSGSASPNTGVQIGVGKATPDVGVQTG